MRLVIKPKEATMERILLTKDRIRKSCLTAASSNRVISERQLLFPDNDPREGLIFPDFYSASLYDTLAIVDAEYFLTWGMFPSAVVVVNLKSKRFRKDIVESIRRLKAFPSKMEDGKIVRAERKRIMDFAAC